MKQHCSKLDRNLPFLDKAMWLALVQFKQSINTMGQQNHKPKTDPLPEPDVANRAVEALFNGDYVNFYPEIINPQLICISRMLSQIGIYNQTPQGLKVNTYLLACVYHTNFEEVIRRIFDLLVDEMRQISQAKIMAMVPRQRFRKCLNMANFCLFFTDQTTLQTVGTLQVRSDLHPDTKQQVRQLTRGKRQITQPLQGFNIDQQAELCRLLRLSMNWFLELHTKLISRSDFTLSIIDQLSRSCWMLYSKLFFSSSQVIRRESKTNSKPITRLAAYFVGIGIDKKITAVYEAGVLILLNIARGKGLEEGRALPSHLYKTLPIVTNNQIIQWICAVLLFSLQYEPKEGRLFCRLNSNRVPALQLLQHIFREVKPFGNQLTYLLEQLCLQTRPTQIERIYVSRIASYYLETTVESTIISRYAETKEVNYNIKSMNKRIKVKPEDVMTQLEGDDEANRKEISSLCNKYVTTAILRAGLMYDYSDKALWGQIINELEHVSEEDVRREEEEDRRDMRLEEHQEPKQQVQPVKSQIVQKEQSRERQPEDIELEPVETQEIKVEAKSKPKQEEKKQEPKEVEQPKDDKPTVTQEVELQPIHQEEPVKEQQPQQVEQIEEKLEEPATTQVESAPQEPAEANQEQEQEVRSELEEKIDDDEHEAA